MAISQTLELARICGELTGDGHIQLKEWRGLVSFYSKNLSTIKDFEERFKGIFQVEGHIYTDDRRWRSYRIFFISKEVAKALTSSGVPSGNKTDIPFLIPEWIFNGKPEIKAAYLRGIFSAEGSIYYTKRSDRWRIEIEMYKRESLKSEGKRFFTQIKDMLESLQIRCSPVRFGRKNKRKDGSYSIALKLDIEQPSFTNFYKEVGFADELKAKTLSEAIRPSLQRKGDGANRRAEVSCHQAGLQSQAAQGDRLQIPALMS